MRTLRILGLASLSIFVMAQGAMARRAPRGGSGQHRRARGRSSAGWWAEKRAREKGAKVGVRVTEGDAAPPWIEKRKLRHSTKPPRHTSWRPCLSNFSQAPPEVLGTAPTGTAAKPGGEAVIRKNGEPIVGITFPADWQQTTGPNYISAVSADGQAYAMLVAPEGIADKEAGLKKLRAGLGNYLTDIKFDEPSATGGGTLATTGTENREEVRRPGGVRGRGPRCREGATRRSNIRRRFEDRGPLQGDGTRHLPDASPRRRFRQALGELE